VFRELTERFHYGLIDTPPTNTVADIGSSLRRATRL